MGRLARGDARWDVYIETRPDPDGGLVRGRIHFVAGDRHRVTAWVFLEATDKDVRERFAEFGAAELWSFADALGP